MSLTGKDAPFFPDVPEWSKGGWIEPYYADILRSVEAGQNPFTYILAVQRKLYYPTLGNAFQVQICVLSILFALTICIMLLAVGLRISQGQANLFVRLDRTIVLPSSLLFPICAIVHSALGIAIVAGAHRIAHFQPYPVWFQGVKASWIAPLWTGIFFEVWACFAAWYIRRYGAQYRESRTRTIVAFALPITIICVAWVPPIWFFLTASQNFNNSIRVAWCIRVLLEKWETEWTPEKGIEVDKLSELFEPGGELARALQVYSERISCGSRQVYLTGASLELSHLTSSIRRLQSESEAVHLTALHRRSELSDIAHRLVPVPGFDEFDEDLLRSKDKGVRQWKLMEWTKWNRILTTLCISAMLLQNAGFQLWKGLIPLSLVVPSTQFQADILIGGWMNSVLSTLVSILILFRSLDGSSPLVIRLKARLRFLPFPPSLEPNKTDDNQGPRKDRFLTATSVHHLKPDIARLRSDTSSAERLTYRSEVGQATSKSSKRTSDGSSSSKFVTGI
ncbi:hypothetical protein JCM16303_007346 [Sporobolomyces ruberrimus]